jgi:aminocarboxymuconate-semialdehyde decarboxylase
MWPQACEDLGAAVFVHPWDMQEDGRMAKYWFPWYVSIRVWLGFD